MYIFSCSVVFCLLSVLLLGSIVQFMHTLHSLFRGQLQFSIYVLAWYQTLSRRWGLGMRLLKRSLVPGAREKRRRAGTHRFGRVRKLLIRKLILLIPHPYVQFAHTQIRNVAKRRQTQ